jgi:hypothetical protein
LVLQDSTERRRLRARKAADIGIVCDQAANFAVLSEGYVTGIRRRAMNSTTVIVRFGACSRGRKERRRRPSITAVAQSPMTALL